MISTRKIFNQVNHVNLRYLRAIELSATRSVVIRQETVPNQAKPPHVTFAESLVWLALGQVWVAANMAWVISAAL